MGPRLKTSRIFLIIMICAILNACAVARSPIESEGGIGGTGNQDNCATRSTSETDGCDEQSMP